MITSAICTSYKKELMEGVHTSADEYKIALYTSVADLSASTTAYTTVEEVVGTGNVAAGQTLTNSTITLDGTTAIFDADNPTWVNATLTARGALLYNVSKSNKAVAVLDFGADYSATNGSFVVVFPSPTSTDGLIRLA